MSYIRNGWYVAGWVDQLGEEPTRIRIMDEWVALYRLADGTPTAIGDICPHRFASLSQGKIVDDMLQCPYHGLRYDKDGVCRFNPHGDRTIPPRAKVASYPLVERYNALWIWMGDREKVDAELIPDLEQFDKPALARSHGYLHVRANYQLVADNLLDLTHAEFLHPFLVPEGAAERTRLDVRQDGVTVWSMMWIDHQPITPLFSLVWDNDETQAQFRSHTMWTAPSSIAIDTGMAKEGEDEMDWPTLPSFHLLTPETENSAHYFWMIGRNRRVEDSELGVNIHNAIHQAFTTEDEPMIARAQDNMGEADFWDLEPAILSSDKAAIRARRITQKLIREEGREAPASVKEATAASLETV